MKRYSLVKYSYDELLSINNISCEELLEELFDFSDISPWFDTLSDNPSDQAFIDVFKDYITTFIVGQDIIDNWIVLGVKEGDICEDFPNEKEIAKFMRNLFDEWRNEK